MDRLLIFSEDFGESIVVLTNLDDRKLYNLLVQFDEDRENSKGRSLEEILNYFVECEVLGYDTDDYIREFTDTFTELSDIQTQIICYYNCFQFSKIV